MSSFVQVPFLKQYEALKSTLKPEDSILFMDGVHPQHNTMPAYGWVKKGKDKLIKANTGRKRININGALDAENLEVVKRIDETINDII